MYSEVDHGPFTGFDDLFVDLFLRFFDYLDTSRVDTAICDQP